MCFIPHTVCMGPFPVPNHSSAKCVNFLESINARQESAECPTVPQSSQVVLFLTAPSSSALRLPLGVCLCESERGISPFGPALLVPSEQPGQGTQAQFGGSQLRLNCKENIFKKSTSGSVLTL